MTDQMKPLYTISATARGGRNGHTESEDELIRADLSVPKEMGGPGKPGTATPEHLFAAGYAACFCGAVDYVARQRKRDTRGAAVTCSVTMGRRAEGGTALSVVLRVEDGSIPGAELRDIAQEAHDKVCLYSQVTRGNVEVRLEMAGS